MTKIEWVRNADKSQGKTWNPVTGCSAVSEGCRLCYARRMARRLAGRYGYPEYPHHFDVTLRPDRLDIPLRRKKPTTYFICSMSDLFHEDVPFEFIGRVFATTIAADRHTFQILTKRPERMLSFISWFQAKTALYLRMFRHIWLGVSCENQATADERIPLLLQTPAAVRFVSCEPLLGPIDLGNPNWYWPDDGPETGHDPLSWIICGSESGPGARPMDEDWVRSLKNQCRAAGIPFFYKQAVINGKKVSCPELDGRQYREMPEV